MTSAPPPPASFLPRTSGHVAGPRQVGWRTLADLALDLRLRLARAGATLDRLAAAAPQRRVLVLSVYRPGADQLQRAVAELLESRHDVRLALGSTADADPALAAHTVAAALGGGKFENLNAIVERTGAPGPEDCDWTLVLDDDVVLPRRFLDRLIGVCERFELALAQPALTLRSHAAWPVTRRRCGSLVRATSFVEIGPVTAFRRDAARELIPFPPLRFGWGLDSHWAALARERGWRLGVADALPVRHEGAPIASSYSREEAEAEARAFLGSGRDYLTAEESNRPGTTLL